MNLKKANNRDKKRKKNQGMQMDNRSTFLLEEQKAKRAKKIRQEKGE